MTKVFAALALMISACGSGGNGGNVGSGGAKAASGGAAGAQTGAGGTVAGSGGAPADDARGGAHGGGAGTGGTGNAMTGGAGGGASGGPPMGGGGSAGGAGGAAAGRGGRGGAGGGISGVGGGIAACPTLALKPGDSMRMVPVGSTNRSYVLHVPAAYDGARPVPLVVDFHPLGSSGPQWRSESPYPAVTDPEGVVMAFPSGQAGPSGGAWNVGPCCVANVDDIAFARALVADVEKMACIDAKRVYAVGFSMGGGMSHYVACHAADLFAAVAPASFDLLTENVDACKPQRPIALLSFRSSNDPLVLYPGLYSSLVPGMSITFLGAVATFDKWAEIDNCTGSPTAADSNNCQYYPHCGADVVVGLCTMNTGHAPGKAPLGWLFLKRYTLP